MGTRTLVVAGILGPLLFVVAALIEGATRPGYDAWRNYVSSLSTGDGGWMQIANFLVSGALILAFSVALWRLRLRVVGVLIGVVALALMTAGVFVTDPSLGYPPGAAHVQTTSGVIHGLAGLVVFMVDAVAAVVAALHFTRRGERRFAALLAGFGVIVFVFFWASTAVSVMDELGTWPNGPTGLFQRVAIAAAMGWIAALAYRERRAETAR